MGTRVAIIIERADIALGGAERSVLELASALASEGLEVNVLAAKGDPNTRSVRIMCGELRGKRAGHRAFARALERHFAQEHYDIIHSVLPFEFADVYQPRGGTYAESVLRNAASYENGLMRWYKRVTAFANFRRASLLRLERRLCRNPDGPVVAALSQYVAEQLKRHYGLGAERVAVVPNGVRTSRTVNAREADAFRTQVLTQLNLKEADRVAIFLFVANNFRLKGLGVLIRATSLAARQEDERRICVAVIGGGVTGKYRQLAERLGVRDRVAFVGAVPHVQDALLVSDAAVLPTFYDPASRYILEALACGKPVITTRFNGATDLFTDRRHGIVVDSPQDVAGLAEAMVHFSDAENTRIASEAIAEDNLRERVSVGRAARELISLYELVLRRKGRK